MKTLTRLILILWGITFSTGESSQKAATAAVRPATALLEKTTQTCEALKTADSLSTT